jgi:hypothetical protein
VRITIDNQDGLGAVDYTSAVAPEGPVTLQRALNKPTRCTAELVLGGAGLAIPARQALVTVTANDATLLFTGYLATEPVRIYAGDASAGAVYRARLSAISDEWLLDNLGSGAGLHDTQALSLPGSTLLQTLTTRVQAPASAGITVATATGVAQVGVSTARAFAPWSANAAELANAVYATYRALNGQVRIEPIGSVTHTVSDADGTLSIAELQTGAVRELANDVTLTGSEEPTAYVQEIFVGDSSTAAFELSEAAYRGTTRTLLEDSFNEASFDATQWTVNDPGSHLSLTSAGLTLTGGNGADGQTTLTAIDAIEMSGSVVAQLSGVTFGAASSGVLAGFYQGAPLLASCFAGFRVRQSGGATVVVPIVNGSEVGTVFTPVAGQLYTLRLRLHCIEMQRVPQRYYCMVDGVVQGFGSLSGISAPMDCVFEIVDEGAASATPATILYDSAAAGVPLLDTPAQCTFLAVNAIQLFGSIGALSVTRPGSLWVVSTLPSGTQQTRLMGAAGQGADCLVSYGTATGTTAKITFFAGRVPVVGEHITVSYRTRARSIARLASAASVAAESMSGTPGTRRWLGKVVAPAALSSVDCESAAQALLAFATSRDAALAGTYTVMNPPQDIWPGDVLAITSEGVTTSLLIRSVVAQDGNALPELATYKLSLANDWATEWADGIGLRLSESIATDALLPPTAATAPGQVLANLQQLAVIGLTETTLQIDTGTAPPTGGGFEVRRSDNHFGPGVDPADLVLRSPVRSFSIPRSAQVERFYVRMFDASTPPLYSRWSSALYITAPVS